MGLANRPSFPFLQVVPLFKDPGALTPEEEEAIRKKKEDFDRKRKESMTTYEITTYTSDIK